MKKDVPSLAPCRVFYDRGDGKCLFCFKTEIDHEPLDGQTTVDDFLDRDPLATN